MAEEVSKYLAQKQYYNIKHTVITEVLDLVLGTIAHQVILDSNNNNSNDNNNNTSDLNGSSLQKQKNVHTVKKLTDTIEHLLQTLTETKTKTDAITDPNDNQLLFPEEVMRTIKPHLTPELKQAFCYKRPRKNSAKDKTPEHEDMANANLSSSTTTTTTTTSQKKEELDDASNVPLYPHLPLAEEIPVTEIYFSITKRHLQKQKSTHPKDKENKENVNDNLTTTDTPIFSLSHIENSILYRLLSSSTSRIETLPKIPEAYRYYLARMTIDNQQYLITYAQEYLFSNRYLLQVFKEGKAVGPEAFPLDQKTKYGFIF